MPLAPHTTRIPASMSAIGRVRTRVRPSTVSTTRPQSISGFSTSTQWPSSRTWVSRLVLE